MTAAVSKVMLRGLIAALGLLFAATAGAQEATELFQGKQVPPPNDRLHVQHDRNLTIATAVPSAAETRDIFGMDLYAKNVQPVWVQVENRGDKSVYLTPMGLDPGYFTPRETASRSRSSALEPQSEKLERQGHTQLWIRANSIQSGYIFSRVDEGTKSFNVDVVGDGEAHMLSFFVPVPGLKLDHYEVDIKGMYPESELVHVDTPQLVAALESLPLSLIHI